MWAADSVEITTIVENWIDILLPDQPLPTADVQRAGLIHHFDPKSIPLEAENGVCMLITAKKGRHQVKIMFDLGLRGDVLLHNMEALAEDLDSVDWIVISHGHPDHYGGFIDVLHSFEREIPVLTHPDAFLPRFATMGDGRVAGFYNRDFTPQRIADTWGRPVLSKGPVDLGMGVLTTGEIPRTSGFEGPSVYDDLRRPGLYQIADSGELRIDEVWDEQGLVVHVEGEGLVVLTGCAHAGVINTIRRAQELTGTERVRAIIGGFHLGFPTTPQENVGKTVEALRDLGVELILPMHCSGLRAHAALSTELADRYVQPSVGTRIKFGQWDR